MVIVKAYYDKRLRDFIEANPDNLDFPEQVDNHKLIHLIKFNLFFQTL
jgi:hypothetical protein